MLETLAELGKVDIAQLDTPLLALVGAREHPEGRRQAEEILAVLSRTQPASTMRVFEPGSAADAHCQVGNLPLAFDSIFEWLSSIGVTAATDDTGVTRR